MPELPEVEHAAVVLRGALVGRRLDALEPRHPSVARRLPPEALARLAGRTVEAVDRRGKHQLVRLGPPPDGGDPGLTLHVHFRMAGDWALLTAPDEPPRHTRALLHLGDGRRVALVDPRALGTLALLPSGAWPADLGPEATDPSLDGAALGVRLAGRRGPIKPLLLDQRVLAGVGNIYAAEALWHARIHPRTPATRLSGERLTRLLDGVRTALAAGAAVAARYQDGAPREAFRVYGREGDPCERCGAPIARVVQAGRSTYYCGGCQRY